MAFDLVVRGEPEIGIQDGVIAEIGAGLRGREGIDATGLAVLPGVVDAHVHFNEPGRTE